MENLRLPPFDPPALDLGTDADIELGNTIADLKISAMQQGFDDRYQSGVSSFFQSQCEFEDDQKLGESAAALRIEERRKTLIAIAIQSSIFSGISGLTALLVGFSPAQASIVFLPSVTAAICVSKK